MQVVITPGPRSYYGAGGANRLRASPGSAVGEGADIPRTPGIEKEHKKGDPRLTGTIVRHNRGTFRT